MRHLFISGLTSSIQYVQRIIAFRVRLLTALYRHQFMLEPGRYIIGANLAFKSGSQIPTALMKSRGRSQFAHIWPLLGRGSSLYGQALSLSHRGSVIIFNFKDDSIKRIAREPVFDGNYTRLRDKLSTYLPSPRYTVDDYGLATREELVNGNHLTTCSKSVNIKICSSIILALYDMTNSVLQDESYQHGSELELLVPSHGDLRADNIVTSECSFTVIDWCPYKIGLRPPWYDPLTLICSSSVLSNAYIYGFFNPLLKATFSMLSGPFKTRLRIIDSQANSIKT
jgi:hypothetical protein